MTILVTGTSGFIGSNLTQYLIKTKKKFYGIDKINNPYFKFKNFAKIDLQNKKGIEKIIKIKKITSVIHLAAIPGFVNCHNSPESAFKNNIEATFNLINACKKNKIKKIIIASSMGVDNYIRNPSIYGLSKFICENFANTFNSAFNMNIKICKISNVFGPFSKHKTSAVHAFIKNILKGEKIKIHKKGFQKRDFIFVDDVCKKLVLSNSKNFKNNEILINTNKFLRIIDMALLIKKISKKNNKLKYVKTPDGYDDKVYIKPITKVQKSFIKKLESTYNWYTNNRN